MCSVYSMDRKICGFVGVMSVNRRKSNGGDMLRGMHNPMRYDGHNRNRAVAYHM